ncbi:MAG: class IV adenylate cyclase [Desulfobacterales bacterium]|nr:class IV adenylate cyclase [Desulfobacterales bacterium]
MQKREVEVKFYLEDIDRMQRRIVALGAESLGRVFENNIRYEDRGHNLIKNHSLLRLRQDQKAILTFKSRPAKASRDFKIFNELEVEVSDFETLHQILVRVGLRAVQRYEKWRETLILGPTAFFLDTMPYGTFLEIEGPEDHIRQHAAQLDLKWHRRILLNYLEIFEFLKKKRQLAFGDVTFDNFQSDDLDVGAFLNQLEVGDAKT